MDMWKRIVLFTVSGCIILITIFIILFSNEIASIMYKSYAGTYSKKELTHQLWETTLSKKLSLLREKISLCNIRGGKRIQTSAWYENPSRYTCYLPYSDRGKTCHNSNECAGECIIVSPIMNSKSYHYPSHDPTLKEFNCTGLGKYQENQTRTGPEQVYKTYVCEKNLFKGQCTAFSWDHHNQWTMNDNKINYLEIDLGVQDL